MIFKKKHKIVIGILLFIAIVLFLGSLIISRFVSQKVEALLEQQQIENFHVTIEQTKFSLFDRSLVFKEINLIPKDSSLQKLKNKTLDQTSLHNIHISRLKFRGIQLTPLLFNKKLLINKLIIDDPLYQSLSNNGTKKVEEQKKPFEIDSIHLKVLDGFQLDLIKVTNFKAQTIDIENNKITFENKPLSFEVSGFKLEEISPDYFSPKPVSEIFEITRINVEFPNIKYDFSIDALKYHFGDDHLEVTNLKFKPLVNKLTLSNSFVYNNEVYDVLIKNLKIYNLDLEKIVESKGIFIDSIELSNLDLEIYKDKRKPFDLNKRPKLPHQLLKSMKMPLLIEKVAIKNSKLIYEERLERKDILMKVNMLDLNVNIFNVTSIEEFRKVPLKIDLTSKFMGKANLNVDMIFPLANDQHTFFFSGYLGPSKMTYYDSAIIPALGLKILKGDIESLSFQASATNYVSTGTMKMIYNNLESEVFKQKNTEKNSFLSWSVNNLVHKSNPGSNGEIREATMKFERDIYKGLGNFIWKTVQNGIVNTIAPFGMTTEKVSAKKKRKLKREERRKKRQH